MAKYCKYSTVMNQVEQRLIYLIKTPHISYSQVRYGVFAVHHSDVIKSMMVYQITSVSIVYSTVCLSPNQRKHQSSTSLAFVRGIHRWSVNSPHRGPVTRKMFPCDDVIMVWHSRAMLCISERLYNMFPQHDPLYGVIVTINGRKWPHWWGDIIQYNIQPSTGRCLHTKPTVLPMKYAHSFLLFMLYRVVQL